MKFLARFAMVLLIYIMYGVYLANVDLRIVPEIKHQDEVLFYDYRGAINVRSNLSDGIREPSRIIESAQNAGLDFLIFTDSFKAQLNQSPNNYFERLMVISGFEYKYLDYRMLILGQSQLKNDEISWKVADWLTQKPPYERDAILILSTPFNVTGDPSWGPEWPTGVDLLEVQNPKMISERTNRSSPLNILWSLLVYPFSPRYAFLRLYQDPLPEIELWDKVNLQQKLVGVSGLDASARAMILPGSIIEFPSYQTSFELMSTHVLTKSELVGSYKKDVSNLFESLKHGRVYFSLDLLGNPKGFTAYFQNDVKVYGIGDSVPLTKPGFLHYKLPARPSETFEVVLIRNGQRIANINDEIGQFLIERPGTYRIIVRVSPFFPLPDARKWVTWIYTNSFYISEP